MNMKTLAIIILSPLLLLLAACGGQQQQQADFIPGTYVNQARSNFSVANDTLVITAAPGTQNIYLITRKTGYRRIADGNESKATYQVKKLTGEWDPQKQLLQVMQTSVVVTFQPEQNKLLIGSSEYWKL